MRVVVIARWALDMLTKYKSLLLSALGLGAAALVFYLLSYYGVLTEMLNGLKEMDVFLSAFIFFLLFLTTAFPFGIGNMPYNIATGYVYEDFWIATLVTAVGLNIAAVIAFVVCRAMCTTCLAKQIEKSPTIAAVIRVIEGKGSFTLLILIRLLPLPFGMLNGALAVSKIKLWEYAATTVIGCMPIIMLNSFMGTRVKDLQTTLNGDPADAETVMITRVTFGVQIVVSVMLIALVVWRVKKVLKQKELELDVERGRDGDTNTGNNASRGEDVEIELQPLTSHVDGADEDDMGDVSVGNRNGFIVHRADVVQEDGDESDTGSTNMDEIIDVERRKLLPSQAQRNGHSSNILNDSTNAGNFHFDSANGESGRDERSSIVSTPTKPSFNADFNFQNFDIESKSGNAASDDDL